MRVLAWLLAALAVAGLFFLVWQEGRRGPSDYLRGLPGPQEEAAFCLAVAERLQALAGRGGGERLDSFLDEHVEFWRLRAGSAFGAGRVALAKATADPTQPEDRALFLALQDCAWRALSMYGHRFASIEAEQGDL